MRRLALMAVSTLVICSAAAPTGQDQGQGQAAPVFRSTVSLVRVDVSLSGRDGEPVTGLTADDFAVEEDGIPQRVESVQFIELDGTRTSNVNDSLEIRSPEHAAAEAARDDVRLFAIFLDDYHVNRNAETVSRAKNVLKEFVKQLGPNDLIAIMDPLTPLSALRFTRALDEVQRRIDDFEGRRGVFAPPRSSAEAEQMGQPNAGEIRSGVTLSALSALVNHLSGLREGRKSVLFVSEGPPAGLGGPNEKRLREVLQAANRGNVTIHVYDPQPFGFSGRGGRDVLQTLQRETGGRSFFNSTGTAERVQQVIDDASAYYLIGYAPARELADGQFHRIEVRVRRDGVRVLARNGYWAPTAEEMNAEAPKPPEPELVSALGALAAPPGGRVVDVWMGSSRGPGALTRLNISWDPSDMATGAAPARVTVEQIDTRTQQVIGTTQSLVNSATANDSSLATFDFTPGSQVALRFIATAADGDVLDRWTQPVNVASFGEGLTLSTPRVFRAQSAFAARALLGAANPAPSAARRFRQSDRVFVDVDVYEAGGQAVAVVAELLNGSGTKLVDLPVPAPVSGRARVSLPLSSLAPSTYVLLLRATAGDRVVDGRVAFQIVR